LRALRVIPLLAAVAAFVLGAATSGAGAASVPSGERQVGQSVLEPVYNAEQAGTIGFVSTPLHAPMHANPKAWSPFFVPVYPAGSTVGPLLCEHVPADNCPDHGPGIADAAAAIVPSVYGSGVLGHDHVMDFPGGADFNVAWEPVLVLFTSTAAANEHLLTDSQIAAAVARGDAIEVPVPALTFHCAAVSAAVYALGIPFHG
jgi:hypothetical protein